MQLLSPLYFPQLRTYPVPSSAHTIDTKAQPH